MQDLLREMEVWRLAGRRFALARVLATWGSAPRQPGAAMLIGEDGRVVGSVSSGCVESDLIEKALGVLRTGQPRKIAYGVPDEKAWSVGLSCGGQLTVWVEEFTATVRARVWGASVDIQESSGLLSDVDFQRSSRCAAQLRSNWATVWGEILEADAGNRAGVLVSRLVADAGAPTYFDADFLLVWGGGSGPADASESELADASEFGPADASELASVGLGAFDAAEVKAAIADWRAGQSGLVMIGGEEVFVHRLRQRSRVIVLGAGHIAVSLVRFLDILGLETMVIDPRAIFTERERFGATRATILTAWPQEIFPELLFGREDYIVLLTHDPRIDDPAIQHVLRQPVAYIGALGSKKSHANRRERLLASGYSEEEIGRIKAPIGLKLGGASPEEIALSIVAEIVQVRNGG